MAALWFPLAAYVGCGVLFIAIAIPLVQRRIPPNQWYGFRVERTVRFPDEALPTPTELEAAGVGLVAAFAGDGTVNASVLALSGWSGAVRGSTSIESRAAQAGSPRSTVPAPLHAT